MRLITIRDKIRTVAERWAEKYGSPRGAISDKLRALDLDTATAADVARIVGNDSWVGLECNECGGKFDEVVEAGEPLVEDYDYRSATVTLCRECATRAAALFGGQP